MSQDKIVLAFKTLSPSQWLTHMSKTSKKFHEHTRCRGFTPEEIQIFKASDRWKNGVYADRVEKKAA